MAWFSGLVGLCWIAAGIFGLTATKKAIITMADFTKNTKRQSLGIIALIFGVLFLISATATTAAWFILLLGVMACLKGLAFILLPPKQLKEVLDWWFNAPDIVYKGASAMIMILGVAMFYII